jgi:predicted Rossmann fold nucleotide-binding protein DprA/Smf involved in DNA uptake
MQPALHADLLKVAGHRFVSLNQVLLEAIAAYLELRKLNGWSGVEERLTRGVHFPEIAQAIAGEIGSLRQGGERKPREMEEDEKKVWEALAEGPQTYDGLCAATGFKFGRLASALTKLEIARDIRRSPGDWFHRRAA